MLIETISPDVYTWLFCNIRSIEIERNYPDDDIIVFIIVKVSLLIINNYEVSLI